MPGRDSSSSEGGRESSSRQGRKLLVDQEESKVLLCLIINTMSCTHLVVAEVEVQVASKV